MNDPIEFQAALNLLHQAYPHEQVRLWATIEPSGQEEFTALVGETCGELETIVGWGESPDKAVQEVIRKAGNRDPKTLRELRIAKLRDQLAKLEAAEQPTA